MASRAVQPLLIEHDTVALQAPPWTDASAMDALRAASLHPQLAAGAARHSDLSVPGISVRIDGGQVELFVYGDANTAGRAAASVATTPAGALRAAGDSIPSAASTRPVVLATDNLVAIVLSRSGQVQRRVHDALSRRQHTVSDASLH